MSSDEALEHIRGFARAGRIVFAPHARQRMRTRGATADDVREALVSATFCIAQATEDGENRWKVEGRDLDGDDLAVVVVLEDGLIVVTVF